MHFFQVILVASTAAAAAITIRTASAFLAVSPTTSSSSVSTITALNAATESRLNRWVPAANDKESKFAFGMTVLPRTTTTMDDPVEDFDRHYYGFAEQYNTDLQQQQQQQQQMIVATTQQHLDDAQHHSIFEILASVIISATEFGLMLARWGKNLTMLLVCFIYLQTIL